MLNRYSKIFCRILFVSFLIPASLLADGQGVGVPRPQIGENPRNTKSEGLESQQPVSSGSYDFKNGGQLGVHIDELDNAEKWSIDFFVSYNNQSYRDTDQGYIYASDEVGNMQLFFQSYPAIDPVSSDSVVVFHLITENYSDENETPLTLFVDPDDINEGGFNWVNIYYDGANLGMYLSNGQVVVHTSNYVPGRNFTEYDVWFWFGRNNGGGEYGEYSDYNMDAVHIMRDNRIEIGPPSNRYAPFEETVMLWNFDEMGGEEVFDETIYGNDGGVAGPDDGVWSTKDVFGGEPIVQGFIGGKLFFDGDIGVVDTYVMLGLAGNETNTSDRYHSGKLDTPFPPEGTTYNFLDYRITANSGPYWLAVYLDVNGNATWDDGDYGVVVEDIFTDNNSEAFVNMTILQDKGRISGNIFFDGDIGFAQVHMRLGFPGNNTGVPDITEQRGENTPFPPGGKPYSLQDPQITADSGPYWLEAFFDLNGNNAWDNDEPGVRKDSIFTNNSREAFVDLTIPQIAGRINGNIFFDGDIGFAQVYMNLGFPGNNTGVPDITEQRGENTPFPPGGKPYSLQDPQITADSGPYWLEAFFDLNGNKSWDGEEPGVWKDSIFTNNDREAFVDLHMVFAPPEIVNISPPTDAHEGEDAEINVGLASPAGISFASFEYFVGGSSSMRVIDLGGDPQGGDWTGTIPSSDITSKGLIGRIFVEDESGQGVLSDPMSIEVSFDEISIGSTSGETYRMISAPGKLDDKRSVIDGLVTELLDDDREDNETEFRTFRWNGMDYTETGVASLNPGEAYWIITLDSWVLNGGSGTSIDLDKGHSISLREGWNQIGSPFNFPPNVYDASGDGIEPSFYRYTGSGYSTSKTMNPGEGYWVYANSSTSLKVDYDFDAALARESVGEPFEWQGNITARVNGVNDNQNIFGVMSDASDTWDSRDRHEPPVIGDHISVSFDNTHWKEKAGFYSTDVHSSFEEGHEWPFVVKTNQEGYVSLDFEWTESLPSDWNVLLIDKALRSVTDLSFNPAYNFACACDENGRDFVIITGPPSYTQEVINDYNVVPGEYQLSQNFPNPFNAITTLRFSLPEESTVSIAVYDLLGQKIATLAERASYGAGHHALIWDGRDQTGKLMSTGVYFYRMEAFKGGKAIYQDARKLIMLK